MRYRYFLLLPLLFILTGCGEMSGGGGGDSASSGSSCGTEGTVLQRIKNCNTIKDKAPWDGGIIWSLVTRTASGKEVWMNNMTWTLWSDILDRTYQWSDALEGVCNKKESLEARGNLSSQQWHLPPNGQINGILGLPNMTGNIFWTATSMSLNKAYFYTGNGAVPPEDAYSVWHNYSVRCIAGIAPDDWK